MGDFSVILQRVRSQPRFREEFKNFPPSEVSNEPDFMGRSTYIEVTIMVDPATVGEDYPSEDNVICGYIEGITEKDKKTTCLVCLEPLGAGATYLRRLPCSHKFHVKCGYDWIIKHTACPICRMYVYVKNFDKSESSGHF